MNEKKLSKAELEKAIATYTRLLDNNAFIKTLTKHMHGAFVVRLGRLNAELKRRK